MRGSILGDICGSTYEHLFISPCRLTKEFPFLNEKSTFTDDTVLTVAVMDILNNYFEKQEITHETVITTIRKYAKLYPTVSYGSKFLNWAFSEEQFPKPYNSCGNGAAMRISPVGLYSTSEDQIKVLSRFITEVTHNHLEGIKGAEAVAMAVYLAKNNESKDIIFERMGEYYEKKWLTRSLKQMRCDIAYSQRGNILCEYSVPQAISCFLLSTDYEDCIRNCISIGGDSDTIASIAGGIAEAYYEGVPKVYWEEAEKRLPFEFLEVINKFYDICRGKESN